MRVAMVVDRFPAETFLAEQVAALMQRDVDVHVLCQIHDVTSPAWELIDGVDLRHRIHSWPDRHERLRRPLAGSTVLAKAAKSAPVCLRDALSAELARPGGGTLGRALFAARVVAVGADVVHFQFGDLARRRAHLAGSTAAAFTASFRGYDLAYAGLDQPGFYDPLWPVLDGAHTLGADLRQLAFDRGCPPELEWTIIPPAVDGSRLAPVDRDGRTGLGRESPLRIVSVGRLHWKKGYELGMAAVAELVAAGVRVEHRIVGAGDAEEMLRWTRRDLGLERVVRFVGRAGPREVVEHLRWADVFLHPALSEGFGNAVLEAQAVGLPVVCSDAEGLAENVVDGRTGFVVPRRDTHAAAARLRRLADDDTLRSEMGSAGRRRALADFGLDAQADAFVDFFDRARHRRWRRDR